MTTALTWMSYFVFAVVLYYAALFAVSKLRPRRPKAGDRHQWFALIVPARNEELVLDATLRNLTAIDYPRLAIVVVNDGSTDRTWEIADSWARRDRRIIAVNRPPDIAGRGKSDVLNHAYRVIRDASKPRSRFHGASPHNIIVGIVDADGGLEPNGLSTVCGYFDAAEVGSVQIGVRIGNATNGLLARLQDMEFVGFSCLVQIARDRFGSSGLGGNGQFTRLSALIGLGERPWSPNALTEDLDLGLILLQAGWRTRYCRDTFVTQQGLTSWRPLLRQRTRWIQGHYQCWKHLPGLCRTGKARLTARIDLSLYLVLVLTVVVVFAQLVIGVAASLHLLEAQNTFLSFLGDGSELRVASLIVGVTPLVVFLYTYQRHSAKPLEWWEVPAYGVAFTAYSYIWITATVLAWGRIATGRWNWTKTPRVAVGEAHAANEALGATPPPNSQAALFARPR
jgi:cellulose synthase/poly-beta-1,6-N-acetylglucosamine synthase-like glycosyltransferase